MKQDERRERKRDVVLGTDRAGSVHFAHSGGNSGENAGPRDKKPPIKPPKTADERITTLREVIEEQRAVIRAYDEQWALYEHNMQRQGPDPAELRRPLDPIERSLVKSRRRVGRLD